MKSASDQFDRVTFCAGHLYTIIGYNRNHCCLLVDRSSSSTSTDTEVKNKDKGELQKLVDFLKVNLTVTLSDRADYEALVKTAVTESHCDMCVSCIMSTREDAPKYCAEVYLDMVLLGASRQDYQDTARNDAFKTAMFTLQIKSVQELLQ
jgi:hypothetical protein